MVDGGGGGGRGGHDGRDGGGSSVSNRVTRSSAAASGAAAVSSSSSQTGGQTPESYVVIGGEGFLGHQLLQDLHERYGSRATLWSSSRTQRFRSVHWSWIRCDLTSSSDLTHVFQQTGATTVFLCAASHLDGTLAEGLRTNVEGTRAVVEACRAAGVRRLVLSSTTTVIFRGESVEDADETVPTVSLKEARAPYSYTKALAEQIVMEANGKDGLYTTAIRPNSFLGAGDNTVIPISVQVLKQKQAWAQIGNNTNLCEFDHIRNVTLGHMLACEKLLDPHDASKPGPAAGEIFNITGGKEQAVPLWTFLRELWKGYNGYEARFNLVIPYAVGAAVASVNEAASRAVGRKAVGLTMTNVIYATAARWHNIDKAKRILGYEPKFHWRDALHEALEAYKEDEKREHEARRARGLEKIRARRRLPPKPNTTYDDWGTADYVAIVAAVLLLAVLAFGMWQSIRVRLETPEVERSGWM